VNGRGFLGQCALAVASVLVASHVSTFAGVAVENNTLRIICITTLLSKA